MKKRGRNVASRSSVRLLVASRQQWQCNQKQNCVSKERLLPARFEIDHIFPLARGGKDCLENLQALCPGCHAKKTSKDVQWLYEEKQEWVYGTSKYFDEQSTCCLLPPPRRSASDFLKPRDSFSR